jgi:hypothetical protein
MALGLNHSFDMHRGDDRQLTYDVVDQQTPAIAVDISAATFIWVLANQDASVSTPQPLGDALVTKEVGTGVVITDGPNGGVRVDLGSGDTAARLAPAEYYHELQMTLGGLVTTLVYGIITLKRDRAEPGP